MLTHSLTTRSFSLTGPLQYSLHHTNKRSNQGLLPLSCKGRDKRSPSLRPCQIHPLLFLRLYRKQDTKSASRISN
jgi:hypothetical protein